MGAHKFSSSTKVPNEHSPPLPFCSQNVLFVDDGILGNHQPFSQNCSPNANNNNIDDSHFSQYPNDDKFLFPDKDEFKCDKIHNDGRILVTHKRRKLCQETNTHNNLLNEPNNVINQSDFTHLLVKQELEDDPTLLNSCAEEEWNSVNSHSISPSLSSASQNDFTHISVKQESENDEILFTSCTGGDLNEIGEERGSTLLTTNQSDFNHLSASKQEMERYLTFVTSCAKEEFNTIYKGCPSVSLFQFSNDESVLSLSSTNEMESNCNQLENQQSMRMLNLEAVNKIASLSSNFRVNSQLDVIVNLNSATQLNNGISTNEKDNFVPVYNDSMPFSNMLLDSFLISKIGKVKLTLFKNLQSSFGWVALDSDANKIKCSLCQSEITIFFSLYKKMQYKLHEHQISQRHILISITRDPERFYQMLDILRTQTDFLNAEGELIQSIAACLGVPFTDIELKIVLNAIKEASMIHIKKLLTKRPYTITSDICRGFTVIRIMDNGHPIEHLVPENFVNQATSSYNETIYFTKYSTCYVCAKQPKIVHNGALHFPNASAIFLCLMDIKFVRQYMILLTSLSEMINKFPFEFYEVPNIRLLSNPRLDNVDAQVVINTHKNLIRKACLKIFQRTGNIVALGLYGHSLEQSLDLFHLISFYKYLVVSTEPVEKILKNKQKYLELLHKSYLRFRFVFYNAAMKLNRQLSDVNLVLEIFYKYLVEIQNDYYSHRFISASTTYFLLDPFSLASLNKNIENLYTLVNLFELIKTKIAPLSFKVLVGNLVRFGQWLLKDKSNVYSLKNFLDLFIDPNICREFPHVKHFYSMLFLLPYFPAKRAVSFITLDLKSKSLFKKFEPVIAKDLLLLLIEGPRTQSEKEALRKMLLSTFFL